MADGSGQERVSGQVFDTKCTKSGKRGTLEERRSSSSGLNLSNAVVFYGGRSGQVVVGLVLGNGNPTHWHDKGRLAYKRKGCDRGAARSFIERIISCG